MTITLTLTSSPNPALTLALTGTLTLEIEYILTGLICHKSDPNQITDDHTI